VLVVAYIGISASPNHNLQRALPNLPLRLRPTPQSDYREALAAIADLPTTLKNAATGEPVRIGTLQTSSLSQAAAVAAFWQTLSSREASFSSRHAGVNCTGRCLFRFEAHLTYKSQME